MIKYLNILFLILFILVSVVHGNDGLLKKYYLYKIEPGDDLYDKFFRDNKFKGFVKKDIKHFLLSIKGDQKKLKDDDLIHIIFKQKEEHLNIKELVFKISSQETWAPRLKSRLKNDNGQFGQPFEKNILISEDDILNIEGDILELTYNNKASKYQFHGDQNELLSKKLKNYEKDFINKTKFIRTKISFTQKFYSPEGQNNSGDMFTLRDIDIPGKKSFVTRTNLEMTRFFYQSKDSLHAQEIRVTNFNDNVITPYKIWQSSKDMILPDKLQLNGVFGGDLKNGTLINYDNPEEPKTKTFSYKAKNIRLNENIFEFNKDIKPKEASFWRYKGNIRGKDWVFLDSKYKDKFVYLLDEEYAFKKDKEKGKVFAPVESGGESRKTLGDLKSVWVPLILTPIVFLSFIGSL